VRLRRSARIALVIAVAVGIPATGSPACAATSNADDHGGYAYKAAGKRDPFRPFALQHETPVNTEPLTPLQRYEIGQLKLVGIVYNVTPPRAMVEDDQGLGFILTPGTPVGPNGGVVTAIEPRQVVVVEWQTDVIGEKHRKEYILELPSEEKIAGPRRLDGPA
jgi:type IV pilus assembly protein PilP